MFTAEDNYFFRHGLLRDAAYDLQLPSERASAHKLAFLLIEQAFGDRAPALPDMTDIDAPRPPKHSTDIVASELANHAHLATPDGSDIELCGLRRLYLVRHALYADSSYKMEESAITWQKLAEQSHGVEKAMYLRRVGLGYQIIGNEYLAVEKLQAALAEFESKGEIKCANTVKSDLASTLARVGKTEESESMLQEALKYGNETGANRLIRACNTKLASLYLNLAQYDKAEEALIRRGLISPEDPKLVVNDLVNLTTQILIQINTGRLSEAEEMLKRMVTASKRVGDRNQLGSSTANLGVVYLQKDQYELAEETFRDALVIHRDLGDLRSEGLALCNIASARLNKGDLESAFKTFQEALAIQKEIGNRRDEGITLSNMAGIYMDLGDFDKAAKSYLEAIEVHKGVGNVRSECIAKGNLAEVYTETGEFDSSLKLLNEIIPIYQKHNSYDLEGLAQSCLGRVLTKLGRLREAERVFEVTFTVFNKCNAPYYKANAQCVHGLFLALKGEPEQGKQQWQTGFRALKNLTSSVALDALTLEMVETCKDVGLDSFAVSG